jgi:type III secretory pathway component EscV
MNRLIRACAFFVPLTLIVLAIVALPGFPLWMFLVLVVISLPPLAWACWRLAGEMVIDQR